MRITRENAQLLVELAEAAINALEEAKEAADEWDTLQDGERNAETAEEIRTARELLEEALENVEVSDLCELIHGKHPARKAKVS